MTGWDCEAYGPKGLDAGALCYFADPGTRNCLTAAECAVSVAALRQLLERGAVTELLQAARTLIRNTDGRRPPRHHALKPPNDGCWGDCPRCAINALTVAVDDFDRVTTAAQPIADEAGDD